MSDRIREALAGMLAIVDESRGVDGYHLNGDTAEWDEFPEVEAARAALAQQPAPVAQEPVAWVLFHNNDVAYDRDEPIICNVPGDCLDESYEWRAVYVAPPAAEPDTVKAPRELLAEAESIIESYAESLKASHAPGGDWEGEEAAHDEYELEAGVASKLRALLAGGAE